jgi:hypothetical protein
MSFEYVAKRPIEWEFHVPRMTEEHLGMLINWIDQDDPRGAAEQLDSHYPYGGFKQYPMTGFRVEREKCLKYPGDPLLKPMATAKLRDEVICFYDCEIVAVFQKDGSYVAARFD